MTTGPLQTTRRQLEERCRRAMEELEIVPRDVPPNCLFNSVLLYGTCFRRGFFPSTDHLFLQAYSVHGSEAILKDHAEARRYVNSLHRVPKILRWHVPNIISITFAETPPEMATRERIRTFDNDAPLGGERHSIFLVDPMGAVIGGRLKETRVSGTAGIGRVNITFHKLNPDNRAYHLAREFVRKVFAPVERRDTGA